jgi:preprotein translocase subunit SecF
MKFLQDTKVDFLGKKYFLIGLSLIVIIASIAYTIIHGLQLGIDFRGGNLIHLKYQKAPAIEEIRSKLAQIGYANAILQADVQRNEVMIRVQLEETTKAAAVATTTSVEPSGSSAEEQVVNRVAHALATSEDLKLGEEGKLDLNMAGVERLTDLLLSHDPLNYKTAEDLPPTMTPERYARGKYETVAKSLIDDYREIRFGGVFDEAGLKQALAEAPIEHDRDKIEQVLHDYSFLGRFSIIRAEMVSAVVGGELAEQTTWAIIFSLGGILVYVWFRFNPRFSVAAIIATVHDVIITVGIFSMSGREYNLPVVAALLTIVGYSLNDTIVIFSRIRENLNVRRREAKENYEGVLNDSINQTLSRTILTSSTTLFVVLSLFFLGGPVVNDFSFTMIVGIVVGTYSSIYIASPVLSIWQRITGTMGGALAKTDYVRATR